MSIILKKIEHCKKQFGSNLKSVRESKGISQFELASAMNDITSNSKIERTTISRIENGRTNITLTTALKLALALKIELKDLFNFDYNDLLNIE